MADQNDLSLEDAQKLFNDIASANKDGDANKLTELVTPADSKEEADTTTTDDAPADDSKTDEGEGKDSPQDEPAGNEEDKDKKDDKADEPDEVTKLREQLATVQQENHNLRSQAGRVPHIQRRLQELDKKLAALTSGDAPSRQPSKKITPKVQEILKGIGDTDPELAKAVAEAIGAASDEVAKETVEQDLRTTQAEREAAYKEYQQEQASALLESYPNAAEVFKSKFWTDWKAKQSQTLRSLAESDTASDVIFAFERYAEDMKKQFPELGEERKADDSQPDQAAKERAAQIEAERTRKKQTAVVTGSPSASGKVTQPDDPAALFAKFSEEIRKSRLG